MAGSSASSSGAFGASSTLAAFLVALVDFFDRFLGRRLGGVRCGVGAGGEGQRGQREAAGRE